MPKRVLIIGAGIAGLSAGSYLVRNGYDTLILEKHSLAGGVCTAWERKGYLIDYCIHWLLGTRPDTGFDLLWKELGAFVNEDGNKSQIRDFDFFTRIDLPGCDSLTLYSDADRLEAELLRIAPEDKTRIRALCRDIKRLSTIRFSVDSENSNPLKKIGRALKNSGAWLTMMKQFGTPHAKFLSGFKSDRLRHALGAGIPENWSTASLLFGLAVQHSKSAGYPVGGSRVFARNIERAYLNRGGQISFRSPVSSIIVEKDRAVGVRLCDGGEIRGDYVISAADGHSTLFDMLQGGFVPKSLHRAYRTFPLFPSSVFLGFGIDRDLSDLPHSLYIAADGFSLPDGARPPYLALNVYNFDPTLAQRGKTVVTVLINTWNDEYWRELAKNDRSGYDLVKKEIEQRVLDILEKRLGGIRAHVEVSDVSTPHTVFRYTGNWHGSYEGFAPTPGSFTTALPKRLPGLKNFFMIGQWTTPGGGLPPAARDGRDVAVRICALDKKRFSGHG